MPLSDFYRSDEWEAIRQIVINERVNPSDGFVYCEYCNKPILKPYDLICHHEIELTETNYKDASIALNPLHIKLVHHRCHNRIHEKAGFKTRKVYIVYGSPLSGKTTFVNSVFNSGDLIVDIDRIWECVSNQPPYIKPPRLKGVVFDVRDKLYECVKYRKGNWNTAYIIGGFPLQTERKRLCDYLNGECLYISSTKDECLKRLRDQDEKSEEWVKYITDWWKIYAPG